MKNNKSGFIQIIVVLVVILVVLSLLGLNIGKIWDGLFLPIFSFIGKIILIAANFLTGIVKWAWAFLQQFAA